MRTIYRVAVFNRRRFDRRITAVAINATQDNARCFMHRERVGTRMTRNAAGALGHRLFGQLGPWRWWCCHVINF